MTALADNGRLEREYERLSAVGPFVSVGLAAGYLGVSRQRVRNLVDESRLDVVAVAGYRYECCLGYLDI